VLSCKPTPYLECQTNSLTYLCVTRSVPQRRRRLVLILNFNLNLNLRPLFLLLLLIIIIIIIIIILIIPFNAGAIEKCHEGLWGQANVL
jgi:hypothetical protein